MGEKFDLLYLERSDLVPMFQKCKSLNNLSVVYIMHVINKFTWHLLLYPTVKVIKQVTSGCNFRVCRQRLRNYINVIIILAS